jgi:hypothetical protein
VAAWVRELEKEQREGRRGEEGRYTSMAAAGKSQGLTRMII